LGGLRSLTAVPGRPDGRDSDDWAKIVPSRDQGHPIDGSLSPDRFWMPVTAALGTIADDTAAEMIGAEFERASDKRSGFADVDHALSLWIDVPSPNQAGLGSMPKSVGRAMICTNPKGPGAKPQPDEARLFSSPR
jgi:hypothetical protein